MSTSSTRRVAAALLLAFLASGCETLGITEKNPVPPCPPVLMLRDAGTLTRYAPGRGRDITDIDFQAEIADFRGTCEYNKERTEVDIVLNVVFSVLRGPADTDRAAAFEYFVAIPHFHPAPEGKRTLPVSVRFTGNESRVRSADQVTLHIPFGHNARLEEYAIYLGFQLTREELKENQSRRQP